MSLFVLIASLESTSPKKDAKDKEVTAEAVATAEEEAEYDRSAQGTAKIFSTSKPKVHSLLLLFHMLSAAVIMFFFYIIFSCLWSHLITVVERRIV